MTGGVRPKWSASWPGPLDRLCRASRQSDPAIHVDHRVKPGDDDFLNHRDGETVRSAGIETSPLNLCASVVNILDAPDEPWHDGLRGQGGLPPDLSTEALAKDEAEGVGWGWFGRPNRTSLPSLFQSFGRHSYA